MPAIRYRQSGTSKWYKDPVVTASMGVIYTDRARSFVESLVFDKEDMFIFLSRHVGYGNIAKKRNDAFFGRFLNWGSGMNPYYIAISGAYLRPILKFMEIGSEINVTRAGEYWLRLDIAEVVLAELAKQIPHKKPLQS